MTVKVTIPEKYETSKDLVAISHEAYEKFMKMEEEIAEALEKIERGEKEYLEGKTETIDSVSELAED